MRNYGRFWALLNAQPISDKDEVKMTLVSKFSNGRTTSMREMEDDEYERMCRSLEKSSGKAKSEVTRWRHICLQLLSEAGVNTQDWGCVNNYCMSKKIAGKAFKELNQDELIELSKKLRVIVKKLESTCKL